MEVDGDDSGEVNGLKNIRQIFWVYFGMWLRHINTVFMTSLIKLKNVYSKNLLPKS